MKRCGSELQQKLFSFTRFGEKETYVLQSTFVQENGFEVNGS